MTDGKQKPHPLDGVDPFDRYNTMMAERTSLITSRQDAENNLVRTIIQMSSALTVLMAGFVTQTDLNLDDISIILFGICLILLIVTMISGLSEQWFSSQAYKQQQVLVEKYYSMEIDEFTEPNANKFVRACQLIAFLGFTAVLILLSIFAFIQVGGHSDVQPKSAAAATPSAAPSAAAATPSATAATPSAAASKADQ